MSYYKGQFIEKRESETRWYTSAEKYIRYSLTVLVFLRFGIDLYRGTIDFHDKWDFALYIILAMILAWIPLSIGWPKIPRAIFSYKKINWEKWENKRKARFIQYYVLNSTTIYIGYFIAPVYILVSLIFGEPNDFVAYLVVFIPFIIITDIAVAYRYWDIRFTDKRTVIERIIDYFIRQPY